MFSPVLHAPIVLHNFEHYILMFPDLHARYGIPFAINASYTGAL